MNSAEKLSNPIPQELAQLIPSLKRQSQPKKAPTPSLDPLPLDIEKLEAEADQPTLGQRVADVMAARVGSWAFLIGQTVVLTGWVGANLMPGVPHWDQSPFILLNLVFSFASAYTAPVVLMSQNRQSDEERKKAEYDHLVNRKASHDIELLHKKIDVLQSQQLQELTQIIKQQQQQINEFKGSIEAGFSSQQSPFNTPKLENNVDLLAISSQKSIDKIEVAEGNLSEQKYSVYIPFNFNQSIVEAGKGTSSINASLNS